MKIKEQTITLDSLRLYAYHGAEPQEAIVGAWYTVSIAIKTDATLAVQTDDLNGTINYAKVAEIIKKQNKANLMGTKYFGASGMPPCPITTITAKTNFNISIEWFLISWN